MKISTNFFFTLSVFLLSQSVSASKADTQNTDTLFPFENPYKQSIWSKNADTTSAWPTTKTDQRNRTAEICADLSYLEKSSIKDLQDCKSDLTPAMSDLEIDPYFFELMGEEFNDQEKILILPDSKIPPSLAYVDHPVCRLKYWFNPATQLVECFDSVGNTKLHLAVLADKSNWVTFLITMMHVSPNILNHVNSTPLHCAAWENKIDIAKILLSNKALVDPINTNGDTPLIIAASRNFTEMAQLLVDHGASVDVVDTLHMRPRDYFKRFGMHVTIVDQAKKS